jgi:osmoprotectant transport system ATP-binding protein
VQISTADDLLAKPADDFVASFVGADRGLKRLRVRTVADVQLEAASADGIGADEVTVTRQTSLHDALSAMLAEGTTRLEVVDGDRRPIGSVRMESITKLIAPETEPTTRP